MRAQQESGGFTLVELLVVIALVGLVVALVVINIERDTGQLARLEAERFHALVRHAQDESLLSGRPFAIEVDENTGSYRFLEPGEPWQVIKNDDVLRSRRLPEGVSLRVKILESGADKRFLVVDGLGLITPFILTFEGGSKEFAVFVDTGQNVRLKDATLQPQGKI